MSAATIPTTGRDAAPALLTVPEACDALRISKGALYRLIRERRLATITIGRKRLVPVLSVSNYVESLVEAEEQS